MRCPWQILESKTKPYPPSEFRELAALTLINACTLDEENRALIVDNEGIRVSARRRRV